MDNLATLLFLFIITLLAVLLVLDIRSRRFRLPDDRPDPTTNPPEERRK